MIKWGRLPMAIIIMSITIVATAILGWIVSWLVLGGAEIKVSDNFTEVHMFFLRVIFGLLVIGFFTGTAKLWDMFCWLMTVETDS